ncbi:MAG: serine hydrolase [Legionellales bacterium]|nr:serine hydrolase [Legionellales bacterium]
MLEKYIRKLLLACLILLGASGYANAQMLSPDETAQLVSTTIKPILERNHVAGATVVLYNHGVPQAFYFGLASRNQQNHVNASTLFEIGSVTKIFTSVLLAYEVELGQLDLSDPAVMYLNDAPISNPFFDQITLAGLAAHVSGLAQMPASTIRNRHQLMQSLKTWRPAYKVNSWWRYSNIGFGILGYVLEDITHQSYQAFLKQQLLNPLNMNDTSLTGSPCLSCAQGYSWNGAPVTTTKTLLIIPAAGSIRSSGRDMLKFLGAALSLPGTPPELARAFQLTERPYYQTQYGNQGLGWEIHDFNQLGSDGYINTGTKILTLHSSSAYSLSGLDPQGLPMFDKTGSVAGFRAYMVLVPKQQTGLVILVNAAMPRTQVVLAARKVLYQLIN